MADDVLVNKAAAIERAIGRLREEYAGDDKKMVGFRNVAIHDYQKLNLDIVRRIIVEHLDDFLVFTRILLRS